MKKTKKSKTNKTGTPITKTKVKDNNNKNKMTFVVILLVGILMIVSTYAWFSTSVNVKIKNFNMIVSKNSGLTISFDGINYDSFVEISEDLLINRLKDTYPNNTSQWASLGLTPISTTDLVNNNTPIFNFYSSSGVKYKNKNNRNGFVTIANMEEKERNTYNRYLAFDLFLKNDSGSPVSDNLFLDTGTSITMDSDPSEEMTGLVNSIRVGFIKIGSVDLKADTNSIQNISCNNNCSGIIYEPNSANHTAISIERATKYGVTLVDGQKFPTYGCIKSGGPIYLKDLVSGSPNMDMTYFQLQNTITEVDFSKPLFEIPNGITKVRVYLWIEGQDIDSLETDSQGADISISIDFVKDTAGYTTFND